MGNRAFSTSLTNFLIRVRGTIGPGTKLEVVELCLKIAQKVKAYPEILPAWFAPQHLLEEKGLLDEHEKFAGKTQKSDFPLFYLLVDEIHEEGDTGDFARTGLLYIIQSASDSVDLEQWLVESDLATTMASGLGALYGQLSRKLVLDYPQEELPLVLALSDYKLPNTNREVVSSSSPDFQIHMDTFLAHLMFWQDVLENCKSAEVKDTLLEHFQIIFLQQLLYPSLLESSDIDGGSSVAVLNTLRRILEALKHPSMIHLILHYLLALPNLPTEASKENGVSAARRRKSMDLATIIAHQEAEQSPSLWSLVDLIQASLQSSNQQTVVVTLQLLSTILRRHHRYSVITLFRTSLSRGTRKTIAAHEQEVQVLLTYAGEIGCEEDSNESYNNHVKDSMTTLESHPCSQTLILSRIDIDPLLPGADGSVPGAPPAVKAHTLRKDDSIAKTIFATFETFLTNPVDTNLGLTEVVVDLLSCGHLNLDGWLLPDPSKYEYDKDDEDDEEIDNTPETRPLDPEFIRLQLARRARRRPKWPPPVLPPLFSHIETLLSQISTFRETIPRFDDLLQQRRKAFSIPADDSHATPVPTRPSLRSPQSRTRFSFDATAISGPRSRSASPTPSKSAFDSLAQRIFPTYGDSTPSRSSSPAARGRRSQELQRSSTGGNANATTAVPAAGRMRSPPTQLAASADVSGSSRGSSAASPLRGAGARGSVQYSDSMASTLVPGAWPGGPQDAIASQAAAFAEVDREILARRIPVLNTNDTATSAPLLSPTVDELDAAGGSRSRSRVRRESAEAEGGSGEEWRDTDDELDDDQTLLAPDGDEVDVSLDDDRDGKAAEEDNRSKTVSVSHILTNVVLLQEFLLELASLVQIRASMFKEVRFSC